MPAIPHARTRRSRPAIAASALQLFHATPLLAQTATPTTPTTITGGRSLTFEYVIVVVMIGLALFAVCRGSRRN